MLHQDFLKALVAKDYQKLVKLTHRAPELLHQEIDENSPTPLHYYLNADIVDEQAVNFLLSLGANPLFTKQGSCSAIDLAVSKELDDICTLFLDHQSSRRKIKKALLSQLRESVDAHMPAELSASSCQSHIVTAIQKLCDFNDEISIDSLFERAVLINSLLEAMAASDDIERMVLLESTLEKRANFVSATQSDYQFEYHYDEINEILASLCQELYPDKPKLGMLLASALVKTVVTDNGEEQKAWQDIYSCDTDINEVFVRDKDGGIHLLSSIVARAIVNLTKGEYQLNQVWKKVDLRGSSSEKLDSSLIKAYSTITPSFQALYDYTVWLSQEKNKCVVLNRLQALRDGLQAGSVKVDDSDSSETIAGSAANIATSEFMSWWNEFYLHHQDLAENLLAIRAEGGASLHQILEPLISPDEHLSRADTVYCVDTIGLELARYLDCVQVQQAQRELLHLDIQEKSLEELQALSLSIDDELQNVSDAAWQSLKAALPKPFSLNLYFAQAFLYAEKQGVHLTYTMLENFRLATSSPLFNHSNPLASLCALADDDEEYISAHLNEQGEDDVEIVKKQLTDIIYSNPILLALYAGRPLVNASDVFAKHDYWLSKYYLLAIGSTGVKLSISQEVLQEILTSAVLNHDYDFIPSLLDLGLDAYSRVMCRDLRFNDIGVGNNFYVQLPMLPESMLIRGEVISRRGAVIRLRFKGKAYYDQEVDDQVVRLYLDFDESDDREYNLEDDDSRSKLKQAFQVNGRSIYRTLKPDCRHESLLGLSTVTGHISLFRRLLTINSPGDVLRYLFDDEGHLLCHVGLLMEFVSALPSHPRACEMTREDICKLSRGIILQKRYHLLLPLVKAGLLASHSKEYPFAALNTGDLGSLVDYMFKSKVSSYVHFFLLSENFDEHILHHSGWLNDDIPYQWIEQYAENLTSFELGLMRIDVLHKLLFRSLIKRDICAAKKFITHHPDFSAESIFNELLSLEKIEEAMMLFYLKPKSFNASDILVSLCRCNLIVDAITMSRFAQSVLADGDSHSIALLWLYRQNQTEVEIEINGDKKGHLNALYSYSLEHNDSEIFYLTVSQSSCVKRQEVLCQLMQEDKKKLPLIASIFESGINIWPHIACFDRASIKELLQQAPVARDIFFSKFLSIYNALFESRNFSFFRAGHHWTYRNMTVDALFQHISECPDSLSARAVTILLRHTESFAQEVDSVNQSGKSEQLALFMDVHQQSQQLSFFVTSKINQESTWKDIQSHIKQDSASRSAIICQRLGLYS